MLFSYCICVTSLIICGGRLNIDSRHRSVCTRDPKVFFSLSRGDMDTCVNPNVPPWKLELINRRRIRNNQSKCVGGGGGCGTAEQQLQVKPVQWTWSPTTQHFLQQPNAVCTLTTPPPPPSPQQQQQQQRQQQRQQYHQQQPPSQSPQQQQQPLPPTPPPMPAVVAIGTVCTGMRLFKCEATIMTNFKKNPQINRCRSKFKTKPQIITEITNGLDYRSDSSEEFKYGPGIVNKLKSKYMSMTVREQRPRPPLRRSTSMDNIVEDKRPDKAPAAAAAVVTLCSQPDVISVAAAVKSETMKRARSMEVLSEPHATTVTIINANGHGDNDDENDVDDEQHQQQQQQQPKQTNGELPPPDVVKTYKKIFETKTQNDVKPPIKIKPAILPKPTLSPEKTRPTRTNKVPSKKTPPPIKYPNRYNIFSYCQCVIRSQFVFSHIILTMVSTYGFTHQIDYFPKNFLRIAYDLALFLNQFQFNIPTWLYNCINLLSSSPCKR